MTAQDQNSVFKSDCQRDAIDGTCVHFCKTIFWFSYDIKPLDVR